MAWNVVILGGGFGGLYTARKLERTLPHAAARVTLINDVNFMLYTPLLPGAGGGTLEPRHVVVPLREQLKSTQLKLAHVTGADPSRKEVTIRLPAGGWRRSATTSSWSRSAPPRGRCRSRGWRSTRTASRRSRRRSTCATGSCTRSSTRSRSRTTRRATRCSPTSSWAPATPGSRASPSCRTSPPTCSTSTRAAGCTACASCSSRRATALMPEISAGLADFAGSELRRRGIEIRLGTTIERVSADSTELSTGEVDPDPHRRVDGRRQAAPDRRRSSGCRSTTPAGSVVDKYCQVEGFDDVWAIGDAAAVPDPARPGHPSPPTCQHAIRQGRTVGAQRRGGARRGHAQAVHLQDARRVRRHGPPPGGGGDARDQVARLPGVVPRPHVPPVR